MSSSTKMGVRARITEFAEDPMQGVESLIMQDQPYPDADSLTPQDVVIAVKSSAVGWVDLIMTSGQYQHLPPLPYTPGLEYSGVVDWIGDEVKHVSIGDRVAVDPFQAGPRSPGNYQQYGGFASYAVAPAKAILPLPDGFSFDEACNLMGSYETAYHCLIHCGDLQPGETVLVHGASGATGLAAVHIAKIVGATVIATGRTDAKLQLVQEQGADHVVNCSMPDGARGIRRFRDDVKALTGGKGVDIVYDGVGGDISIESLRCVQFGARFLIVGWASTPLVAKGKGQRGAPNANVLPTNLILMKGLKVLGCPAVISVQNDPSIRPKRIKAIMDWVGKGKLKPYISHTFPLSEAKQALFAKWNGEITGGCAVHPPEIG